MERRLMSSGTAAGRTSTPVRRNSRTCESVSVGSQSNDHSPGLRACARDGSGDGGGEQGAPALEAVGLRVGGVGDVARHRVRRAVGHHRLAEALHPRLLEAWGAGGSQLEAADPRRTRLAGRGLHGRGQRDRALQLAARARRAKGVAPCRRGLGPDRRSGLHRPGSRLWRGWGGVRSTVCPEDEGLGRAEFGVGQPTVLMQLRQLAELGRHGAHH